MTACPKKKSASHKKERKIQQKTIEINKKLYNAKKKVTLTLMATYCGVKSGSLFVHGDPIHT